MERRKLAGYPTRNDSFLARLHVGYRRGSPPGFRSLVPGDATGKGINEQPRQWAGLFWAGDPDYQSDEKWWDAVKLAEEARKKKGANLPPDLTGGADFGDADETVEPDPGARDPSPAELPPVVVPEREPDPMLSGSFELAEIPGSPHLEVTGERLVTGRLANGAHIEFAVMGSRVNFVYDPRHQFFTATLLEPVDCLVEELAYQILARSSTTQQEWPLSRITQQLRERYFQATLVSFAHVRESAEAFLGDLVAHLQEQLPTLAPLDPDVLDSDTRDVLTREVARVDRAGRERVDDIIRGGEFARYLGASFLPSLVDQWPELVLDSTFLALSYADVQPEHRQDIVRSVSSTLRDLLWVLDPGGTTRGGSEWRSMLARAAGSVRLLEAWRA